MLRSVRLVLSALVVISSLGCPMMSGSDGGSDGGRGDGGADAGFVNLLPDVFESAYGRAVVVHGGKVYVAGNGIRSDAGTDNDFFVARFNTDLTRDPTFGVDGIAVAAFDGGVLPLVALDNDSPLALAFDGDKPVLAGSVRAFTLLSGDLGLARFTSTGQLDTTFGTGGLRLDDFGTNFDSMATTVVPLSAGGFLVGGGVTNGSRNEDIVLLRYDASGAVDPTFALTAMGAGAVLDFGFNLAEEARGLFVQGTNVVVGGGYGFGMARLLSSGQLDVTFGPNATGMETNGDGSALKILQRADGSFWLLGGIELNFDGGPGTDANFLKQVLVDADGRPVAGFGTNGRRADLVPTFGAIRGAALQADGKALVYFAYIAGGRLLRLNTDGSLDTSFGTNGIRELDIRMPLFEGGNGTGNHLTIDGTTAWIADINVVDVSPSRTRQVLALVKVAL